MAMTAQLDRRRRLDDAYGAVPEHQRAEVIDGTLYVSPRPARAACERPVGAVGLLTSRASP
jgi:hypothetical protein